MKGNRNSVIGIAILQTMVLLLAVGPLFGEDPPAIFAFRFGSFGVECGKAIAIDSKGNVVLAGSFQNSVDFDPGPGSALLRSHTGSDMVIAKYSKIGRLIWAKAIGGTADVTPRGLALDATDRIYVVGDFGAGGGSTGTADFDPGPGTANLTSSGSRSPFVAKYDADGTYVWARTLNTVPASPTTNVAWDLAVDDSGNVFFTGSLQGTLDLDASPDRTRLYTSQGGSDIFCVKYDNNGNYAWGFALGGAGDDDGMSVALDGAGSVFLSGTFTNSVDFDPGPGITLLNSAGNADVFVLRLTTGGAFQNAIRLGGLQPEKMSPGAMRTDSSGRPILTGQFQGTIDFDPGSGTQTITNSSSVDNSFVAAFSTALDLRWAFSIASPDGANGINRIVVDSQQDVWIAGWFSGTADFDGGAGAKKLNSRGKNGATDIFLAKYDGNGGLIWVRGYGAFVNGADNLSFAAGLALDPENKAYLTGQFFGQVDFNPTSTPVALRSAGFSDGFVVNCDAQGNLLPTLYFPRLRSDLKRYTGIAVANWGKTPADVEFTAFDDSGSKTSQPTGVTNPKTLTIPAGGQVAMLATQIFNLPSDQPGSGWAQAQGTSSQLAGFFLEGGTDLTYLDGAVAGNSSSKELFFTRGPVGFEIVGNGAYENRIDVVNPNPVSARIDLKLLNQFGVIQETATRVLGPLGRMSEELTSLFPSMPGSVTKGYVKLSSNLGVIGYQSVEIAGSVFALPAQPRSTRTQLVSAQFASGQAGGISYFTALNILNTNNQRRTVQLMLIDNGGAPASATVTITLDPGEAMQERGDVVFGLADPVSSPLRDGSLVVTADGPGIIGDVVFGDPVAQKFMASLVLDGNPASDFVFSQVAEGKTGGDKTFFTGIAIYNPNGTDVSVTIDVYSLDGTKTGTATVPLAAGGRFARTLPQLVPAVTSQFGGYIRVSSTAPISAFELFGDQVLDFLAAVASQPITP